MISQYIRNKKNQKIGVIVAEKNSFGEVRIGWSLCNKKDEFNKALGIKIAVDRYHRDNRAIPLGALIFANFKPKTKSDKAWVWINNPQRSIIFPRSIVTNVITMGKRAQKYFKMV